jgi:Skp family chaperone for outer membrane proteins
MPEANCVACGTATAVGAAVGARPHVRPLCGRACALVQIGDELDDLAAAERGMDEAAAARLRMQTDIDRLQADIDQRQAALAADRDTLNSQRERYRQWLNERSAQLRTLEEAVLHLTRELAARRTEEALAAARLTQLARTVEKLRRRAARGPADRAGDSDDESRSQRLRYAPTDRRPDSAVPFYVLAARQRATAPAQPSASPFGPTYGDTVLASSPPPSMWSASDLRAADSMQT